MQMMEFFHDKLFLCLAIGFGIVHGFVSLFFFVKEEDRFPFFDKEKIVEKVIKNAKEKITLKRNRTWWFHQFFLNGTGAFIGWVALYYFFKSDMCKIGIQHFIALLIGFLGVTGYLPYAILRKGMLQIGK
jgi:hypothetical protein